MRLLVENNTVTLTLRRTPGGARRRSQAGLTLVEVLIAMAIVGLVFGGVINCYIQGGQRVQWTGYSLAAQSLASTITEQVRSATWDPAQANPVNNMTNLNLSGVSYNTGTRTYTGYSVGILDIPYSSTNFVLATNFVTVQMIYVGGVTNVQMQFIRVDTVWPFSIRGNKYFTNTVSTMVAPDDRQL